MSRTVFDNRMVAHVWAQQHQYEGRSHNGNLWFVGDTIYSYRTPVARIVSDAINRIVLITSERYSVTTSGKHMPAIGRAVHKHGAYVVFTVPSLGIRGAHGRYSGDAGGDVDHATNVQHLKSVYQESVTRAKRARHFSNITDLRCNRDEIWRYCSTFGIVEPEIDVEADIAAIAAAQAVRNTPEAIAKRERAAERRRLRELRSEEEKRCEWLAGGRTRWTGCDDDGGVYLRVTGDKLETSLGATVPLAHAIKAFRFIKMCRGQNRGWRRNGQSIRVGHFSVDSISPDGTIVAGCHRINWNEIERIAVQVGVFDDTGSEEAIQPIAAA